MDITQREQTDQFEKFYNIFNEMSYRRYVLKYHIDVPDSQRQSTKILKPKSELHEYKNFTYSAHTFMKLRYIYILMIFNAFINIRII